MTYLEELQYAIKQLHGVAGQHRDSVPHTEIFQGKVIWEGAVEVFELIDHPKANLCYAWGYPKKPDDRRLEIITVLGIPPVTSPETAVKVGIAGLIRPQARLS